MSYQGKLAGIHPKKFLRPGSKVEKGRGDVDGADESDCHRLPPQVGPTLHHLSHRPRPINSESRNPGPPPAHRQVGPWEPAFPTWTHRASAQPRVRTNRPFNYILLHPNPHRQVGHHSRGTQYPVAPTWKSKAVHASYSFCRWRLGPAGQ